MGWSLSLVMALTVALTWFHNSSTHRVTVYSEQAEMRERAWEMVRLMNGINDRLYTHPAERTGVARSPSPPRVSARYTVPAISSPDSGSLSGRMTALGLQVRWQTSPTKPRWQAG